ncbi:16S rRNA (guanine(966)-N(2))-methyltransferase RsmD [Gordonia sp. PKS22-38]|uniref:16S rRNA (Guanine(966)-N(2))-methyltransferase RsmD n=1 Tax=Gordonia prachuapensis TaxID=3115651 RepID=A0ABU7MQS7_9ACTN|nr:16S rRNA (guanine(966)-N(2))-methyltransferase RsmD [Gordonia sp. PKS22-38]
MTRIIAGELRGRRLTVPDAGTRPTSDRVREAIFNIVAARADLDDADILDLYAGTGALGIEALSRGATHATFVDSRRRATSVISANIAACGLGASATVVTRPVATFLSSGTGEVDIAFLDPPYDLPDDTMTADLAAVAARWIVPGGLVIVERAARAPETQWPDALIVQVRKTYGDTRVEVATHGGSDDAGPESGGSSHADR